MDFNLSGRTAVVTGASTDIGLTVIRLLAASGARLPPTCGWAATASTAARPRRNPFGLRRGGRVVAQRSVAGTGSCSCHIR